MALEGGLIKEANNCSQWFFSLHSVASGLEKPLLADIVIALFLASFLPQHQHLSDVAVLPGLIPNDAKTTDRHPCHHLHCLSRSAVFTCLSEFVVHGCTGLLFKVLFITWIDHFFQNSTENSSMDVWKHWSLSGWLTFSIGQYPASRVASIFRLI